MVIPKRAVLRLRLPTAAKVKAAKGGRSCTVQFRIEGAQGGVAMHARKAGEDGGMRPPRNARARIDTDPHPLPRPAVPREATLDEWLALWATREDGAPTPTSPGEVGVAQPAGSLRFGAAAAGAIRRCVGWGSVGAETSLGGWLEAHVGHWAERPPKHWQWSLVLWTWILEAAGLPELRANNPDHAGDLIQEVGIHPQARRQNPSRTWDQGMGDGGLWPYLRLSGPAWIGQGSTGPGQGTETAAGGTRPAA